MSILDKMKNLFLDEEEEPVKAEVSQVEIPAPTKKEVSVTDNETLKNEEKVNTPIFFDDNYFKELEQPKKEIRSTYMKEQPKKEIKVIKEEKKQFKPTPIISPVYGVLDKNYSKDDITTKHNKKIVYHEEKVTYDDVRKKAFGTLEDELENTLFGKNSILFSNVDNKEEYLFKELESNDDVVNIVDDELSEVNIIEEEMDNKMTKSELFDLIDSMYEKGDNND